MNWGSRERERERGGERETEEGRMVSVKSGQKQKRNKKKTISRRIMDGE
jgi:hypothetical protein